MNIKLRYITLLTIIVLVVSACGGGAVPATPTFVPANAQPAQTIVPPTDTPPPPTATTTNTPVPPTQTSQPTSTATATASATATNTSVPPSDTPAPTNTPVPPTSTARPRPTNTPIPPSPTPVAEFAVRYNFQGYERWGRPQPGNCAQKDNGNPVLRLTWDVFVTNNTTVPATWDEWTPPVSLNNLGGDVIVTCYFQPPTIAPGQTVKATFTTYLEQGQWVSRVRYRIRNTRLEACLDKSAAQVPC